MGFLKNLLSRKTDKTVKSVKKTTPEEKTTRITKVVAPIAVREEKLEKGKEAVSEKQTKMSSGLAREVFVHPLVTEKSAIAESNNKYSFITTNWATKGQIKKAILELYGVEPVAINTVNYDGHYVSFRGKKGRRKDYKKAVVTLPTGKTIDIHKGV